MLKERRNADKKERLTMLRRRLQQWVLVTVLALSMFTFVAPPRPAPLAKTAMAAAGAVGPIQGMGVPIAISQTTMKHWLKMILRIETGTGGMTLERASGSLQSPSYATA